MELSATLDEVTLCAVTPAVLSALTFDRQADHYKPAILWTKWILQVLSPNLRVGRNEAPGLLFDMNRLFESAIATVLRRASASQQTMDVGAQDTGSYLTTLVGSEGRRAFRLRPDIVIREGGSVVGVADTKWACVEVGRDGYLVPKEAHLYQMQAYASIYPCEHFALIYPSHSGLGEAKPTAFFLPAVGGRKPVVSVVCIDLASDAFTAESKAIGSALDRLLGIA